MQLKDQLQIKTYADGAPNMFHIDDLLYVRILNLVWINTQLRMSLYNICFFIQGIKL